MEKLEAWLYRVDLVTIVIGAMVVVAMAILTIINIVSRETGAGLDFGAVELVTILITVPALLPLGAAQAAGGHINVTVITDRLKGRWKFGIILFQYAVIFVVMLIVARYAIELQIDQVEVREQTMGTIGYPKWIIQFVFPVGVVLLLLRVLLQICQLVLRYRRGTI
jgi:TRAP-type C4-dicarboxylate transport system permease small subunit